MKRKIKYNDKPLGMVEIVPDFLPSPSELLFKDIACVETDVAEDRVATHVEAKAGPGRWPKDKSR